MIEISIPYKPGVFTKTIEIDINAVTLFISAGVAARKKIVFTCISFLTHRILTKLVKELNIAINCVPNLIFTLHLRL